MQLKLTVQHQASDHTRTKHGNESVDNWYHVLNSFYSVKIWNVNFKRIIPKYIYTELMHFF